MEKVRPGAAHERLLAFVGEWDGEEDLAASPWAEATTVKSRNVFRPAVEGLAVVQEYAQQRPDGEPFSGHGFFTADPVTGDVRWYFFDSVGWPPEGPVRGGWDGSVLTMTKTTPRGQARHTYRFDGDRFEHEVDARFGDAAEFAPFLRARYRRRG